MPRPCRARISLVVLLLLGSAAYGLYIKYDREEVGPARVLPGIRYSDPESTVRFSPLRCYWRESGWDGWGASHSEVLAGFRGDVHDANAALAAFLSLPAQFKTVRLFPGPGAVHSTNGKEIYPCDWEVRWARDRQPPQFQSKKQPQESHTAVLTLFIARADPIQKPDPRVGRWIRELDDDSYPIREQAMRALAGHEEAAHPALRIALDHASSPEQRRRIRRLLDRLKSIHLANVKLPQGVHITCLDELLREAMKDWQSRDYGRTWLAINRFYEWAEYSEDTLPLLKEALRDQREQVRSLAEKALARVERRLQGSGKQGIEDYWRENRQVRSGIAEVCRSTPKQPRKPGKWQRVLGEIP